MAIPQDQLPTEWQHGQQFPDSARVDVPFPMPSYFWWRLLKDFARGYPAFQIELAWGEDRALHFATVAGLTFAEDPDGVDEKEVLDRRRIPLHQIRPTQVSLSGEPDIFTLANGETYTDWPGHLVLKLLAEGAQHPQP